MLYYIVFYYTAILYKPRVCWLSGLEVAGHGSASSISGHGNTSVIWSQFEGGYF